MATFKIRISPGGEEISGIKSGARMIDVLRNTRTPFIAPCGGKGKCGRCVVRFVEDPPPPTPDEMKRLSDTAIERGDRLACYARIFKDSSIFIPPQITEAGGKAGETEFVRKFSKCETPFTEICWNGGYAIAADIGTTTVAMYLLDVTNKTIAARAAFANLQASIGADVISRVEYILKRGLDGLQVLQSYLINAVNAAIKKLCQEAGIYSSRVCVFYFAGNTIMEHIFLGIDPSGLVAAPYREAFEGEMRWPAEDLKLRIGSGATVANAPNISPFVGGDISAGIIALELDKAVKPALFIDFGTNGEIVLAAGKKILCTSTAAGPAFEGGAISSGMTAGWGAIGSVKLFDNDLQHKLVAGDEPLGICGSGLADAVSALLRGGLIDATGAINPSPEASDALKNRIVEYKGLPAITIAPSVRIMADDIRQFQLAKAAVRVGVETLLAEAGVKASELDKVYFAGAFGSNFDPRTAVRIGIIPSEIDPESVILAGNTAGRGAVAALLCEQYYERINELPSKADSIDLNERPDFQDRFINAINF